MRRIPLFSMALLTVLVVPQTDWAAIPPAKTLHSQLQLSVTSLRFSDETRLKEHKSFAHGVEFVHYKFEGKTEDSGRPILGELTCAHGYDSRTSRPKFHSFGAIAVMQDGQKRLYRIESFEKCSQTADQLHQRASLKRPGKLVLDNEDRKVLKIQM